MAYIGTSPSNGVRRVHTYTATARIRLHLLAVLQRVLLLPMQIQTT